MRKRLTPQQAAALDTLSQLVEEAKTPLLEAEARGLDGRDLLVAIALDTSNIHVVSGGLPISGEQENVLLSIPPTFPWFPPLVSVEHARFVGRAHVLQGFRLCVFLDPSREWHPSMGIDGFLEALWRWFGEAAAGKFDASTALFHPVGGVVHRTPGTPAIVVRDPLQLDAGTFAVRWLHVRTGHRLDLTQEKESGLEALVVKLPGPLRYGAGMTVGSLAAAIAGVGFPSVGDFLGTLAVRAARIPAGSPLYFVLAVPTPIQRGPEDYHLIAGRLPPEVAETLRQASRGDNTLPEVSATDLPPDVPIEWCLVSEERDAVTTRRDARRPSRPLVGSTVTLWGCGGLGSWIGEFVARAGASQIILSDPGEVLGGLLVRQNYQELDVGLRKDQALASRLATIRDDLNVQIDQAGALGAVASKQLPKCDVLVDATVSNSVTAAIGSVWEVTKTKPLVATVAADRASATTGLMTITRPGTGPAPEELDSEIGKIVKVDSARERFHSFWDTHDSSDEILPAPGCSVPTFHGSVSDVAGLAATFVSLIGPHLKTGLVGCHLVALPYGPGTSSLPCHDWLELSGVSERA